jgi:hypothetical protein
MEAPFQTKSWRTSQVGSSISPKFSVSLSLCCSALSLFLCVLRSEIIVFLLQVSSYDIENNQ